MRLRRPLSGDNGIPELISGEVSTTRGRQKLVVIYDERTLGLFVNTVEHSFDLEFRPEAALFGGLVPVTADNMQAYRAVYYGLTFIPLGVLLAPITALMKPHVLLQTGAVGAGLLLPAWFLEGFLSAVSTTPTESCRIAARCGIHDNGPVVCGSGTLVLKCAHLGLGPSTPPVIFAGTMRITGQ